MNKFSLLIALTGLAGLAGCSSSYVQSPIDSLKYRNEPLVSNVETGMSRQEVLRIGGEPSDTTPRPAKPGLCQDYILYADGQQQPYHILFDRDGRVEAKGFSTCSQATREEHR